MRSTATDTTVIRIGEQLGSVLVGRPEAAALREDVRRRAKRGERVVLDFDGVQVLSPSFSDELLAKLPRVLVTTGQVSIERLPSASAALARIQVAARRGTAER